MSSMPRCEAASISTTSSEVPAAIARQAWQVPSGSGVGPCTQLSAFARIRASEVFPVPRGPAKRYAWRTLSGRDRVLERPDDGLLADHIIESLRPVFAIERSHEARPIVLIALRRRCRMPLSAVLATPDSSRSRTGLISPVARPLSKARSSRCGAPIARARPTRGTWKGLLSAASSRI